MKPIANIATRKRQYWSQVWSSLGVLGSVVIIAILLCIAAVKFFVAPWAIAAAVCAAVMGPPVWMFWPDYPTEDDVERDRRLRRSSGLPDDVEPE